MLASQGTSVPIVRKLCAGLIKPIERPTHPRIQVSLYELLWYRLWLLRSRGGQHRPRLRVY